MKNESPKTGRLNMDKELTEKFQMSGRNFQKILREFKQIKGTEIVKDNDDTITLYFKGKKILVAFKGIGGKGRSVRAVKGALSRG
jgi:hypothetical protein